MFDDFKKAVLNSYTEKKAANQLSVNLMKPTRVNLKSECLDILKKRYQKKDDETIKAFFDPSSNFDNHEQRIQEFEPDSFKALSIFFLGKTNIRKEENIKLLAWLIDFEPRPYAFGEIYNTPQKQGTPSENEKPIDEPILNLPITTGVPWKKIGIITFLSILFGSLSIYIFSLTNIGDRTLVRKEANLPSEEKPVYTSLINNSEKNLKTKPLSIKSVQCMYWASDHYSPVPCDKEIGDTTKIALDTQKVAHFKKINDPDTLTRNSLGKIWYVSINGSREYYTSEGFHPIHTDRKLKRLSGYILNKYILSKR